MCGWLRKLDSHKITQRRRWVVLDGSHMMYYEDRAVCDLLLERNVALCSKLTSFHGVIACASSGNAIERCPAAGRLSMRCHVHRCRPSSQLFRGSGHHWWHTEPATRWEKRLPLDRQHCSGARHVDQGHSSRVGYHRAGFTSHPVAPAAAIVHRRKQVSCDPAACLFSCRPYVADA